jgi:hypothetical protein
MNKRSSLSGSALAAICAVIAGQLLVASPASAGDFQGMTCSELWYERNAIYAENGYCFKTAKARAVFGKACFAPYGKLSYSEQQTVNWIKHWEKKKRCG